jgi:hypothetical protein
MHPAAEEAEQPAVGHKRAAGEDANARTHADLYTRAPGLDIGRKDT